MDSARAVHRAGRQHPSRRVLSKSGSSNSAGSQLSFGGCSFAGLGCGGWRPSPASGGRRYLGAAHSDQLRKRSQAPGLAIDNSGLHLRSPFRSRHIPWELVQAFRVRPGARVWPGPSASADSPCQGRLPLAWAGGPFEGHRRAWADSADQEKGSPARRTRGALAAP
ncbi:MAG: PH domain-containing protein [Trebonia sp.]